jgi:hypothetical protein
LGEAFAIVSAVVMVVARLVAEVVVMAVKDVA